MKNINKEVLKNNDITIEVLITECRVSITDLYVAGILTHFDDLIELGFKATDLMLNTELFSCSSLVRLFKVNHDDMKLKRVEIDLEALIVGKFCFYFFLNTVGQTSFNLVVYIVQYSFCTIFV